MALQPFAIWPDSSAETPDRHNLIFNPDKSNTSRGVTHWSWPQAAEAERARMTSHEMLQPRCMVRLIRASVSTDSYSSGLAPSIRRRCIRANSCMQPDGASTLVVSRQTMVNRGDDHHGLHPSLWIRTWRCSPLHVWGSWSSNQSLRHCL